MIEYLKEAINAMMTTSFFPPLANGIYKELFRLDPKDFDPDVRGDFLINRSNLKFYTDIERSRVGSQKLINQVNLIGSNLLTILDSYKGENPYKSKREFLFINDNDLKKIIERDYFELKVKLFPTGAWKSVVIMAGSILEAILYDLLTSSSQIKISAKKAPSAPKGKSLENGKWALYDLIKVSVEVKKLSADRIDTIDQVLRDYRNFVHPNKEIRSSFECTEAEAYLAIGALDGVCNHLESNP